MAKRKAETQFIDQASHDAETVRLVRDLLSRAARDRWYIQKSELVDILTRKPAAKKARTRAGGK
jgi:hypothetical protein